MGRRDSIIGSMGHGGGVYKKFRVGLLSHKWVCIVYIYVYVNIYEYIYGLGRWFKSSVVQSVRKPAFPGGAKKAETAE